MLGKGGWGWIQLGYLAKQQVLLWKHHKMPQCLKYLVWPVLVQKGKNNDKKVNEQLSFKGEILVSWNWWRRRSNNNDGNDGGQLKYTQDLFTNKERCATWAVVVVQLVERSLPTTEIHVSNPVIDKIQPAVWKEEKRGREFFRIQLLDFWVKN